MTWWPMAWAVSIHNMIFTICCHFLASMYSTVRWPTRQSWIFRNLSHTQCMGSSRCVYRVYVGYHYRCLEKLVANWGIWSLNDFQCHFNQTDGPYVRGLGELKRNRLLNKNFAAVEGHWNCIWAKISRRVNRFLPFAGPNWPQCKLVSFTRYRLQGFLASAWAWHLKQPSQRAAFHCTPFGMGYMMSIHCR